MEEQMYVIQYSKQNLWPWHIEEHGRSHPDNSGANSWHTVFVGTLSQVSDRYDRLISEWNEKKSKQIKTKEREKMTPSLRYKVIKRDECKCVVCGRGVEDGVKLHVDHTYPISKGGKTTIDNLRTLCDECNHGKAARE